MEVTAFENLELIPALLKKVEDMEERLRKLTPPITTKKEVAKFLGRSERTINNYMANGLLVEGYHYFYKNAKIIVFDEEKILEFRDKLARGLAYEKVTV
jgi:hypothetical protein